MKEKLFIFGALGLLVALLVGLNAATYVQQEKIPDSEAYPNRSTYNTGPTGTRAFHDLLVATGHRVQRWEKPISDLSVDETSEIGTFVIVGKTRKDLLDDEIKQLLEWVDYGGRLVIIDRRPPLGLLETTSSWNVTIEDVDDAFSAGELEVLLPTVDPSNAAQMTDGEEAARSLQPSIFTVGVNAVQPSKFATSVFIKRTNLDGFEGTESGTDINTAPEDSAVPDERSGGAEKAEPDAGPAPVILSVPLEETPAEGQNVVPVAEETKVQPDNAAGGTITGPADESSDTSGDDEIDYTTLAPMIHFGSSNKMIVADFPYGYGSIAVISDPYITSNGGVSLVDNAQMAVNVVSGDGIIAFDEYHQGFGANQNRLLNYFYGTPVVPVLLQVGLLFGLIMLSLSKRFARPLPLLEPSRITKLEYVAAMAQLKRSTKAYDLAIENIYTDFRRRVSRLVGIDNLHTENRELAEAISSRTDFEAVEILDVMSKCEDIMHGEATNKKAVLSLTVKIREFEHALGLRRGRTIFRK